MLAKLTRVNTLGAFDGLFDLLIQRHFTEGGSNPAECIRALDDAFAAEITVRRIDDRVPRHAESTRATVNVIVFFPEPAIHLQCQFAHDRCAWLSHCFLAPVRQVGRQLGQQAERYGRNAVICLRDPHFSGHRVAVRHSDS